MARPASPLLIWDRNGHLPCLEESLSLPPGAQGLYPCVRVSVFRSTALALAKPVSPSCLRRARWEYAQPQGDLIPGCQTVLAGSIDLGEQPVQYLGTCSHMNPSYSSERAVAVLRQTHHDPGFGGDEAMPQGL